MSSSIVVEFQAEPVPHWSCEVGAARAVFTTGASGNLAAHIGDASDVVARNRGAVHSQLVPLSGVATVLQVHGNDVAQVSHPISDWRDVLEPTITADALVTTAPQLPVAIFTADCVPIVIATARAVGVVHAGWRGLASNVIDRACSALDVEASAHAVIGPCIGSCCYEVGEEVIAALPRTARTIHDNNGGNHHVVDLMEEAALQLASRGVGVTRIDVCTRCDERLFSWRRDGSAAGRQAVIGWLQPERISGGAGGAHG